MPPTKQIDAVEQETGDGPSSSANAPVPVSKVDVVAPAQRSKGLPSPVQFLLVAILSFSISSLGYSFINEFTSGELATIMRTLEGPQDIAVMAIWRLTELGLGWFANFDSVDLAALNLLSHSPTFYLMSAFYNLSLKTAVAGLAVDVVASFIPFLLLRPLSSAHRLSASVPNREIISDPPILVATTLLATFVYNVVLFLSYKTYLRGALVLHFEGIPTIEPVNTVDALPFYVSPLASTLALASGLAARSFIFTPLATTGRTPQDELVAQFDPVEATLGETIWWNIWGYTSQSKVGIVRTVVAMAVTGVNTYIQCAMTISGVESAGAVIYASVWVCAALFTGLGLAFVGEV